MSSIPGTDLSLALTFPNQFRTNLMSLEWHADHAFDFLRLDAIVEGMAILKLAKLFIKIVTVNVARNLGIASSDGLWRTNHVRVNERVYINFIIIFYNNFFIIIIILFYYY